MEPVADDLLLFSFESIYSYACILLQALRMMAERNAMSSLVAHAHVNDLRFILGARLSAG